MELKDEIKKLQEEKKKLVNVNKMVSLRAKLKNDVTRLKYPRLFGIANRVGGAVSNLTKATTSLTKRDTRKGGKLVFKDSDDMMKKLGFK
jgi:hypothetical protein